MQRQIVGVADKMPNLALWAADANPAGLGGRVTDLEQLVGEILMQ
jgi:hypothetical protein